jgi:hypothetical protein
MPKLYRGNQDMSPYYASLNKSGEIQIERKFFVLTLKENPRGRFLRISEEVGGKRNAIIIPATGLKDFQNLIIEMVKASDEIPAKNAPAAT